MKFLKESNLNYVEIEKESDTIRREIHDTPSEYYIYKVIEKDLNTGRSNVTYFRSKENAETYYNESIKEFNRDKELNDGMEVSLIQTKITTEYDDEELHYVIIEEEN